MGMELDRRIPSPAPLDASRKRAASPTRALSPLPVTSRRTLSTVNLPPRAPSPLSRTSSFSRPSLDDFSSSAADDETFFSRDCRLEDLFSQNFSGMEVVQA